MIMKIGRKLGYGIGDMGAGIIWGMVSSYVLVYLTDSVGMAAAVVGTIILIARVFDGISDALMGIVIDKTHTKFGKAKPWYLVSILPLVINFLLLFNIPKTMSGTAQTVYVFVLYFMITAVIYTIKDVSYNTLPALVADNTKDRVSMTVIRFAFSLTTAIIIGVITVPALNSMGGLQNQQAWSNLSYIFAAVGLATLLISAFSVKELHVGKKTTSAKKKENSLPIYKSIAYVFSNKYFILALTATLAGMTRIALMGASVYYARDVVGDSNLVGIITIASLFPMIIGMLISNRLVNKLGMQKARTIGNVVSVAGALLAAIFSDNFTLVITGLAVLGVGMGPSTATGAAMLSHIADYGEWKHHVKLQGVTFSCNSVATKVGTGLGGALIGWALSAGGYIAGAAAQSAQTIFMIKGVFLYVPVFLCAVSFVTNLFMDIEYKMPAIHEELKQRSEEPAV